MVAAIGIGYWVGSWMDSRFGTQPWLTLGWVLIGIGAAFKALWREARRGMRRGSSDRTSAGEPWRDEAK